MLTILLAYPMAYWIAFYEGRWKSTLFLILVPFFVSFVIRTVQWNFILADDGVLFGFLKDLGSSLTTSACWRVPWRLWPASRTTSLPLQRCRSTLRSTCIDKGSSRRREGGSVRDEV